MKRSSNSNPNTSVKKVKFSEDTMEESSFMPDDVPQNVYHLGRNNYVVVSDFSDVVRIHIRLYKPDLSGRLHPTKKGVSLSTRVWQAFCAELDSSLDEQELSNLKIIENSVMVSKEQINEVKHFVVQRFFKKSDFSRKFVPSVCLLSETEWKELKRISKEVNSTAIAVMYGRAFRRLLVQEVQSRTPSTPEPGNNEEEEMILTTSMTELLKDYLQRSIGELFKCNGCENGWENQLGHECVTEGNNFRAQIYGDLAFLRIDLNDFVKDFVERNIQLSYSITENFIYSLDMSRLLKSAVDLYIADNPDPWNVFI